MSCGVSSTRVLARTTSPELLSPVTGRAQTFTQDRRLLDAAIGRLMGDADPSDNSIRHRLANFIADTAKGWADSRQAEGAHADYGIDDLLSQQQRVSRESRATRCGHASNRMSACTPSIREALTRMNGPEPNTRIPIQVRRWGYTEARNGEAARAAFSAFRRRVSWPFSGARYLAEESGGFAVVNSNSLDQGFERVVRENSAYYRIGYYSTNTRADGEVRRNRVDVSRQGVCALYIATDIWPLETRARTSQ